MTEAGAARLGEGTPPAWEAGEGVLYFDQADGQLYFRRSDTGAVVGPIGGAGSTPPKSVLKFSGRIDGGAGIVVVYMSDSLDNSGASSAESPPAPVLDYPLPACNIGHLRVKPLFNSLTQPTNVEVMVNGAAIGIFVTIPPGSSAYVDELSLSVSWGDGDRLGMRVVTGGPDIGNLLALTATIEILPPAV